MYLHNNITRSMCRSTMLCHSIVYNANLVMYIFTVPVCILMYVMSYVRNTVVTCRALYRYVRCIINGSETPSIIGKQQVINNGSLWCLYGCVSLSGTWMCISQWCFTVYLPVVPGCVPFCGV